MNGLNNLFGLVSISGLGGSSGLPALDEGYAYAVDYAGRYFVDYAGRYFIVRVL